MSKRLNEKVEENFNKAIRDYLDVWYNDRLYAPLGVYLRVKDEVILYVNLSCKFEDEGKKNVPFELYLQLSPEGKAGFFDGDEVLYTENYKMKKPKNEMDFFKKVYDVVDDFMKEYKEEALENMKKMKNKSTNENKEIRIMGKKPKENRKSLKDFKKSKLNESYFKKAEERLKNFVSTLDDLDITDYEVVKSIHDNDYIKDEEGYDVSYWGEIHFSNTISNEVKKEYEDWYASEYMGDLYFEGNTMKVLLGYGDENDMRIDTMLENKKSFKKFNSKAINEAELTELKDAIINREEFVDENVVGTSIGEDYIVSVFDKAVLIFTSDNTPYIIEREDLEEEEMDIVEELYSALEITVDVEDEYEVEEDEEIFVDDNTSDDLDVSEKFIKESSFAKANKELKSVLKDLKDEFDIVSSEFDKGVHGNDSAQEDGYDWLYVGKIKYSNDITKEMLEEYKEWFEDVYGGRFDYDMNDKTIDVELGYGDDKDMIVSMEKFMFESKKSNKFSKKAIKESKQKSKTIIKESGERVTTFKKGFNFKKYSRK